MKEIEFHFPIDRGLEINLIYSFFIRKKQIRKQGLKNGGTNNSVDVEYRRRTIYIELERRDIKSIKTISSN